MKRKPIIAITMGDPGGVGPEVIAKAFKGFKPSAGVHYLLIGSKDVFDFLADSSGVSLPLHVIPTLEDGFLHGDTVNFLDITEEAFWLLSGQNGGMSSKASSGSDDQTVFEIGKVCKENAAMSLAAVKVAAYQAAGGLVDAIVTAPIHKTAMRLLDPGFKGHTEYLAGVAKAKEYAMMFVGKKLKVTLATIHVPLKDVSRQLSSKLIFSKIALTHECLRRQMGISNPKIAVCALNPHGEETGDEEKNVIRPAVMEAVSKQMKVSGPFSADQVFYEAYEGRYDAVISMYHDQALCPFKMISFHDGVNMTLGLPFIRTSPDHGTAFDIAYQNKANPESMRAALELAERLVLTI